MQSSSQPDRAKVTRGRAMVRKIIEHHLGPASARIRYLPTGRTNLVFEVRRRDAQFVVRLNSEPAKIQTFIKEQWAVNRVRALGVPCPEILEVGSEIVSWPYM